MRELLPRTEIEPDNLHSLLGGLFERAYFADEDHRNPHVLAMNQAEVARVRLPRGNQDYMIGRPQLNAEIKDGIIFWAVRVDSPMPPVGYTEPKGLVVIDVDPTQFYIYDGTNQFLEFGQAQSQIISKHLANSLAVPIHQYNTR